MFAYCQNNVVNKYDPSGYLLFSIGGVLAAIAVEELLMGAGATGILLICAKSIYNDLTKERVTDDNTEKIVGKNGPKITSKTVWKNGKTERIDMENPKPGKKPGKVHYHEPNNTKWEFDVKRKIFLDYYTKVPAPPYIQKLLSNKNIQKGINKAIYFLGENIKIFD